MTLRRVSFILGIVVLAAAAGLGWYGWRRYAAPVPPEIERAGLDPELAQAIEAARQQVRQDPYSAARWGDLGKLLRGALLLPEAAKCFAQAERLDGKDPRWPYLQGEALRLLDVGAAVVPLERAAALSQHGDSVAPDLRLAEALLAVGRDDEAEKHLRHALEIEPDDPSVHYNLGVLALARDHLPESLERLKRCQHSPFTRQKACSQLAAIYKRMRDSVQAEKYSRKADASPPDRSWVDPYLTEALTVGRPARFRMVEQLETAHQYREAAERLTELIRDGPEYRAYVGLGQNLGKMGDYAGADRALRSAIELEPEHFKAHYELSRLSVVRGKHERSKARFEEGAASARRAIARRPDYAMARVTLGLCLRELGERKQAIETFRQATQLGPDLAETHLYLGETLAEDGQKTEARECLERAAKLAHPDDHRPREALAKLKN
jgi:tetratricopeptide (TPR) repeat protein